jgi:hypothetical protein
MSKPPRPTLQPPEFAPSSRHLPTTQADDARFDAAETLETPEHVARRVQNGSVRVINTDTAGHHAGSAPELPKEPVYKRGPETGLSTKIPTYVMRRLKIVAAEKGSTIRNILLEALRKDGFDIAENDIWDDRKSR